MDRTEEVRRLISPRTVGRKSENKRTSDIPVQEPKYHSRTDTGLEPYSGSWEFKDAAHLLRRTTFGASYSQITNAVAQGRTALVEQLLEDLPMPSPPVKIDEGDPTVPLGETWVDAAPGYFNERRRSLYAWWTGLMVHQELNIRERLVLFWHNHLVVQSDVVREARYLYFYCNLLRENALGNFKELAKKITIEPAMLRYLNGNTNQVGAANENYARELFELFTIGKGEQVGEGNYTNYTEDDVLAAARVLTGWFDDINTVSPGFQNNQHDTGNKQFSAAFDNQVISNNGDQEYIDLIEMIFSKSETARSICRELYRWFVYYDIDENIEANVIEPMAQIMIANDYEIKPVLRALLNSEHFYDMENRGCWIKHPLELTINPFRQFEVAFPDGSDVVQQYAMWDIIYRVAILQDMELGNPPSVAGWPAYYQEPQYQRIWINAAVLPFKQDFINFFIYTGYNVDDFLLFVNPIPVVESIPNADDPNILIQTLIDISLPVDLNQEQKDFLKEVLIPGLPDFEWTIEWNDYLADPTNQEKLIAVGNKLQALFSALMTIAEYQLA